MVTSYNKEEDEDEVMTLDSKPSTPDPPNHDQVIDSDDEQRQQKNFWKNNTKPILATTILVSTLYGK